jgi:hypothetical protein
MIVYAVSIPYEGLVELFSTREKAEAYIIADGGFDFYYIEEKVIL